MSNRTQYYYANHWEIIKMKFNVIKQVSQADNYILTL